MSRVDKEKLKELEALRREATELKKACDAEERNINQFQQERERINLIWMNQKKKIDEAKAELLNKQREKEDIEEQHKIERKLYQQKIRYTMLKQQDENVELIKTSEISLKQLEDSHRVKEKDFKYDKRSLSKILKEQGVLQMDFIHSLKKENVKKIHDLKNEFELREAQLRCYYRERIKEINFNMEEKRKRIIQSINDKKLREIKSVTEEHANMFNNMKNYYSDLNKKNLARLKNLAKSFWEEFKNQDLLKNKKAKKLNEKKEIEEPLTKFNKEIEINTIKEIECIKNHETLKRLKEEYQNLIKDVLDYEFKLEVTLQRTSYLEKEKHQYLDKYKTRLHVVEQKAGLRNLILEKKFTSLEENLEIKEVQLKELLRKTSLNINETNLINTTLEELELIKEELINQLEDELNKIKSTHVNMIKTYEAKLIEFGIPVEEIGFEPLIPVDFKQD